MVNRRKRRLGAVLILVLISFFIALSNSRSSPEIQTSDSDVSSAKIANLPKAVDKLEQLEIKGRSPKTGYSRDQFGDGWAEIGGCDTRNLILQRDLTEKTIDLDGCKVLSGALQDPYTGNKIDFSRGTQTSQAVQIDHVVALSDAWQKGAQFVEFKKRIALANDSLNLLAVDGPTNMKKGDGDAATWLPPNKTYRCRYVARQIAVKLKYYLWVTQAEYDAMSRLLKACPEQRLPLEQLQ